MAEDKKADLYEYSRRIKAMPLREVYEFNVSWEKNKKIKAMIKVAKTKAKRLSRNNLFLKK